MGADGAAGLLLRGPARNSGALVLLQPRPRRTCWGLPGGTRTGAAEAADTALREAREQAGIDPAQVRVVTEHTDQSAGDGPYTTVVADARQPLPLRADGPTWVPEADVATFPLDAGLAARWPSLRAPAVTLLVDAANVVGSVPDGWWHDRAAAAQRLLLRCAAAVPGTLSLPDGQLRWMRRCVVVLEGAASAAHDVPGVEILRAGGSGDDTLAEIAGRLPAPLLVSADRGLRRRMPPAATNVGPGALLERLPPR